jgi:hypothetical protein
MLNCPNGIQNLLGQLFDLLRVDPELVEGSIPRAITPSIEDVGEDGFMKAR